jgi:hypothetical protein
VFELQDGSLRTAAAHLTIEERQPLRQGRLISTVFSAFEKVALLLPPAAFLALEQKWIGRGCLQTSAGIEPATIIFEEVTW